MQSYIMNKLFCVYLKNVVADLRVCPIKYLLKLSDRRKNAYKIFSTSRIRQCRLG